ncbi:ras guanine nucleotide exchange factor domain-containing protein [Blakeslea trispora]|nr:ras guanine nucleotide exchange factor domain-containing protein [Blakeslea trispora]
MRFLLFNNVFEYFSDSSNTGSTPDDIVDRLLSDEKGNTDENMIPIFLTFFRKFMKPYELVKKLVERFEQDGLSSEAPPTDLQKKIHAIFLLWLSYYWNDFYGIHARRHIILFLDNISRYESLTPICDSLAPLVVREPPLEDPDRAWGLVDDNNEIFEPKVPMSPPPTPVSNSRKRNKKDSGYASGGGFSLFSQELNTQYEPFSLKRLSSTHYSPDHTPCTTTSIHTLSPNLNRLFSRRKQVSHSESHPDLRSSYHKPVQEVPRRAEFAGGLINIDHAVRKNRYYSPPSMMTPSIATTQGHSWATSLGSQLLGTSIISSFRHHRNERDQANDNYKLLIKTSEHVIADQLTWIEAELFTRINPREFVRHIWDNSNNNNTVMASIAHFNFISAWLVTMVVTQSRLSKRVALLQKFMLVAVELRNRNNYNSLMAIMAGINSAAILRLKQTQQAISNKKVYKQFQSLERLMSTDRSFNCYRMALRASDAPGIPYLGIHNQDLVSLAEANKDFRADGTVHWEKFRLMGETIMATMKFKHPGYAIEPDAKLLTFIADCYIFSEDVGAI